MGAQPGPASVSAGGAPARMTEQLSGSASVCGRLLQRRRQEAALWGVVGVTCAVQMFMAAQVRT